MMTHRICLVTAAAILAGSTACREPIQPPVPGQAVASLTTPAQDDGAVLAVLSGTSFGTVLPATTSYRIYWRLATPTELRVVVVGDLVAGPLFSVSVPDTRRIDMLQGSVLDAASRADSARGSLAGYAITLASGAP